MSIETLERPLENRRWREANEASRLLLHDSESLWRERVPVIDRLWQDASDGHFGLSTQCEIYADLGGFECATGHETWQHFDKFGIAIGWRLADIRMWLSWEDRNLEPSVFPSLRLTTEPGSVVRGCLPFHDLLVDYSSAGFETRDCWGEYNWDRLAELYQLVSDLGR